MRTVFFGTPEIAVPALRALGGTTELAGVVCQPDRPAGRGLQIAVPAVKLAAEALGVEVYQPAKVRTGELRDWLVAKTADVAVVLAYGRILPRDVLGAPRRGCMNLHASILPRYRGAAPIEWAILRGETVTGISLMQMDEGLDTGPVYATRTTPIGPEDDAGTLAARLSELAAELVRSDLPRAVSGELRAVAQDSARATLAPPLTREHGRIGWGQPARAIVDLVRGFHPKPGAFTTLGGRALKVLAARTGPQGTAAGPAGTVVRADKGGLWVQCADGVVEILLAQMEGKRAVRGTDLVNGRAVALGATLGAGAP